MSKPKQRKSGSRSKKRTPGKRKRPRCGLCNAVLRMHAEIAVGYCTPCLTKPRSLDPEDTLLNELRQGDSFGRY